MESSVKKVSWATSQIPPHPKAKILNNIWLSDLLLWIEIFAWKLIKQKLSTERDLDKLEQ